MKRPDNHRYKNECAADIEKKKAEQMGADGVDEITSIREKECNRGKWGSRK